jgi:histidinol-phosphate aminotransferase
MSRFWSKVVDGLTPYVPGEQPRLPNLVKLNTNENPYGPSPRVLEAVRAEVADSLRLYPDPVSEALRTAIAAAHAVSVDQVFVGNGSDEVLGHTFQALLKHDAPVLFPDITYSFYPVYCRLYGIEYEEVPLDAEFAVSVDDFRRANGGIVLPNPNAPTGRVLALSEIERLLQAHADSPVVIDEAYVDFGGETAVPLVSRYRNLLVTRTLSKSHSLAGLRVGYAIGDTGLIDALNRVKDSFNSYPVDRLAQVGATAAIQDTAHFDRVCRRIIESRERLALDLQGLGFDVVPSATNFLFVRHPDKPGSELAVRLRDRGVIVRHFRNPPRIAPYLRITVGTDEQCDRLVSELKELLS